jgi:ERCC4-type nuclease
MAIEQRSAVDQSSDVLITIDAREHSIISQIDMDKLKDVIKVGQIDLGDVNISYQDHVHWIIERKTIADLAQSIKDGRYQEQKMRVFSYIQQHPQTRYMYIIEGRYSFDPAFALRHQFMPNTTLTSSILNSMFRDNVYVMMTPSIDETVNFITAIAQRMRDCPEKYFCKSKSNVHLQEVYTDQLIKQKKRDNVGQETCFLMQLSAIPGLSMKRAKSMADASKVDNMAGFLEYLGSDREVASKKLQAINGIGKSIANTIVQAIYGQK